MAEVESDSCRSSAEKKGKSYGAFRIQAKYKRGPRVLAAMEEMEWRARTHGRSGSREEQVE
jgi:hypothetical protein